MKRAVLGLALAAPAAARIDVTETLVVDARDDRLSFEDGGQDVDRNPANDDLGAVLSRLDLRGEHGGFLAGVRIDNSVFVGEPPCPFTPGDARCPVDDHRPGTTPSAGTRHLWPERAHLEVGSGALRIRAGDTYARFGNGLVLSLRKVDELGLDTTLFGGRIDARAGPLSLAGLGGRTNVQNVDPATLQHVEDPEDPMGGARIEGRAGPAVLGAQGLFSRLDSGSGARTENRVAGATADVTLLAGALRASVEGDVLSQDYTLATGDVESRTGRAEYARVQVVRAPWTVLAEVKDYVSFRLGPDPTGLLVPVYHEPPTLEREGEQVPSIDQAVGARLRADRRFAGPRLGVFASGMGYGHGPPPEGRIDSGDSVWHGYAGLDKRFERSDLFLIATAGYRRQQADFALERDVIHGEIDVGVPAPGGLPGALELRHEQREQRKVLVTQTQRFRRILTTLAWHLPPRWELALLYGFDDEFARAAPVHYLGGEVALRAADWLSVKLFSGSRPGGLICASGTCRTLPPYSGVRAELVARF